MRGGFFCKDTVHRSPNGSIVGHEVIVKGQVMFTIIDQVIDAIAAFVVKTSVIVNNHVPGLTVHETL